MYTEARPLEGCSDSFIKVALPAFTSEAHEQVSAFEPLLLPLEPMPGDQIRAIVCESAASISPTLRNESLRLELVRRLGAAAGTQALADPAVEPTRGNGTDGATAAAVQSPATQRTLAGDNRFIRVHADRLDDVIGLLGQHQTVIRPPGRMLRSLRGMSGSTLLGYGDVALVFDVNALGVLAAGNAAGRPARRPPP